MTESSESTDLSGRVLHPELSYAVTGAAMDVHSKLGPGWDEEAYHQAMVHALQTRGIKAESKARGVLENHQLTAHEFELDIMAENLIILELKHLVDQFASSHYLQLINYLKYWNKDLGILLNFGLDRLQYKRMPHTPMAGTITRVGPWDELECETSARCASMLSSILEAHGLGYSANVYKGLFRTECEFRRIACPQPHVHLKYGDVSLGEKEAAAFLIDSRVLVSLTALGEASSAVDLARMLSYLLQTGLDTGIIANFGKRKLQLRLVYS